MSKATIIDKIVGKVSSIKSKSYSVATIIDPSYISKIDSLGYSSDHIKHVKYPLSKIADLSPKPRIEEILPFRVRITNVGIASNYGPGNGAPIGIAVIGVNNYVM
jgi:hypothetical protein